MNKIFLVFSLICLVFCSVFYASSLLQKGSEKKSDAVTKATKSRSRLIS